jgi:predicted transcriptional regulator of viral defense system
MTKTAQISNDQMIFSVQELKDKGFSYYKINQMVDQGLLIKLNKKYYENANFNGEGSDFYYVYAFVPDGVVCLLSAATYYNLSTYRLDAIDVAIPRKAKVSTLPDWPELNVCYFTDDRFDVGIETVEDGNNRFRIYDIEKTVVDIVFYREKIGIEETKEVLTTYLHRRDRNLNRLIRYAEMLKCGEVMKKYLEVLV